MVSRCLILFRESTTREYAISETPFEPYAHVGDRVSSVLTDTLFDLIGKPVVVSSFAVNTCAEPVRHK